MTTVGFGGVVGAINVSLFNGSSTAAAFAGAEGTDGSQSTQTSWFVGFSDIDLAI